MSTSIVDDGRAARLLRKIPDVLRTRTSFRPDPVAINAPLRFGVPDRVFRTEGLTGYARLTATVLCLLSRDGGQSVIVGNQAICKLASISRRTVDESLLNLEESGLIFRVTSTAGKAEEELRLLESIGYTRPRGKLPRRLIVLLWNLPQPGEYVDDVSHPVGTS